MFFLLDTLKALNMLATGVSPSNETQMFILFFQKSILFAIFVKKYTVPNQQTIILNIRDLIGNGKLTQALADLNNWAQQNADSDVQNAITLLSAQNIKNERNNHLDLISAADYNVKCTQINNAVLALLNDLQPTTTSNKVTEKINDSGKTVIQKAEKIYNIDHIDSANFS